MPDTMEGLTVAKRKEKKPKRKCQGELTEDDLAEVVGGNRKRRRRRPADDQGDCGDDDIIDEGDGVFSSRR